MKKIFFFGDSNTYGFDPSSFYTGRYEKKKIWTYMLEERCGITALNRGENGREIPHSDMLLSRLDEQIQKDSPFDEMYIMLGLNDMINMSSPSAEKIAGRMKSLVEWLRKNPYMEGVKITIVAPPPIKLTRIYGEQARPYDEMAMEIGRQYKLIAKDLDTGFVDASGWEIDLAGDAIHFSEQGHYHFGEKMAEALGL